MRRRVLFVTPSLPWPPDDGFAIRVYHLMRGVGAHHEVSVVAQGDPRRDAAPIAATVARLEIVAPSRPPSAVRGLVGLLAGRSRPRQQQRTASMAAAVTRLIGDARPDIVQWETPFLVGGATGGVIEILDEHNLWSELMARRRALQPSRARRALYRFERRLIQIEERRAWARVDASLFTSEREARVARTAGARNVLVVPNGVDLHHFRPEGGRGDPEQLLFVGLLSYGPNRDAIEFFVRDILPRVARRRPAATLTLVGRDAPPRLLRSLPPRVRHLGAVADVRPHLARAGVVVVPLRYGSGTRIKILESMAAARPVVATSLAAEGLDVSDGEHLLLADEPEAFAEAILRVADDARLADRLGRGARALVERRYSWARITEDLIVHYARLIGERAAGPSRAVAEAPR